jgi:hypothetical protein
MFILCLQFLLKSSSQVPSLFILRSTVFWWGVCGPTIFVSLKTQSLSPLRSWTQQYITELRQFSGFKKTGLVLLQGLDFCYHTYCISMGLQRKLNNNTLKVTLESVPARPKTNMRRMSVVITFCHSQSMIWSPSSWMALSSCHSLNQHFWADYCILNITFPQATERFRHPVG